MKIKLYLCGGSVGQYSQYPLGLGYLKSNCNINHDIEIVTKKEDLVDCDIIGLSSNAWGIKEALDIVKQSKIPTIIGGQATLWQSLQDYDFKYIIIGEGEQALIDVLNTEVLDKVVVRPFIKDIDSLKFPIRGTLNRANRYDKWYTTLPILTSRGCTFNCNFCSSTKFWHKVRLHSAEYFIDEVSTMYKQYPEATLLCILDDLFLINKERFEKIYELWMKNDLHKVLYLSGFIRSGLLNDDNAQMMKNMGFLFVRFGAESGSNRILKLLNKQTTVEQHYQTIDIANRNNLKIAMSLMRDIPGETQEDKKLTQQFIQKTKGRVRIMGNYKFCSFPGTSMYDGSSPLEIDMKVR